MYRLDDYDEFWTEEGDSLLFDNTLLDEIEDDTEDSDEIEGSEWMVDELDNEGDILDSINIDTFEEELDEDYL